MTDAREIAGKMTKAQRKLLNALPLSNAVAVDFWNGKYRKYCRYLSTARVLSRKGLANTFGAITPLGLRVRAILQEKNDG